ncbi:hypothetical protein [Streptomyces sp. NPDC056169]|uniref:hypothetical protein n=1 Tax=Streptomyces sp. NPDC056169 TaxID=3345734 RepID=UPI0035DC1A36
MRTPNRLAKIVLTAALGSMALTACGTEDATGKPPAKASAVDVGASANPAPNPTTRMIPSDALETHPDPEIRALALVTRITNECAPGTMPELPALPADDDISRTVGPEEQPTTGPEPLPLPTDIPEPPSSEPTGPAEEVPLGPVDKCGADAHAERIRKAFDGESPADYADLRKKLTALDYLPDSIHRMPDHGGEPRARIDLRDMSMSDNLVLEVTGTARGVTAAYFGAPVAGDVKVTEVRRKP